MRFSWKVPREYIRMTEEQHPAATSSGHIQELDLVENLTSKKEYVKHQIDLPGGSTVYVWKTSTEHVVYILEKISKPFREEWPITQTSCGQWTRSTRVCVAKKTHNTKLNSRILFTNEDADDVNDGIVDETITPKRERKRPSTSSRKLSTLEKKKKTSDTNAQHSSNVPRDAVHLSVFIDHKYTLYVRKTIRPPPRRPKYPGGIFAYVYATVDKGLGNYVASAAFFGNFVEVHNWYRNLLTRVNKVYTLTSEEAAAEFCRSGCDEQSSQCGVVRQPCQDCAYLKDEDVKKYNFDFRTPENDSGSENKNTDVLQNFLKKLLLDLLYHGQANLVLELQSSCQTFYTASNKTDECKSIEKVDENTPITTAENSSMAAPVHYMSSSSSSED